MVRLVVLQECSCTATYHDCDDFQQAEPVFKFTVGAHGDDIGKDKDKPEYKTESPSRKVIGPVLQDEL